MRIDQEHPGYRAQTAAWQKFRDLYAGGEQFQRNVDQYLVQRGREPGQVYAERLERAFYENYIGSIIDWYTTTLFRREPIVTWEGEDQAGREFMNRLVEDCDLRGRTLSDFFRGLLTECLVAGRSYCVVDFPRATRTAQTRAEEEQWGVSRAFLADYPAESLINWSRNERGEFDWVVLKTERLVSQGPGSGEYVQQSRWVFYDRQRFAVYERAGTEKDVQPALVDEGPHGMAKIGRVPVFELAVSEGLWLMNKAAGLQLEHFNKSNALGWALTMGLFAMPVVYSDREWDQMVGESYYLQLGPQDKFGWTEPEGHVYEIALANIDRLKEEIYRVCYLSSQAGGSLSKNANLTGISKQRDYTVTQEILRGFGDTVKDTMRRVLGTIVEAREDRLRLDVSGLDEFDIGDFSSELSDAERLLALGVPSPTLRRQVFHKLAMKYLCDVRQGVKDRIAWEIETAE
jgi:hypothetical protein